MSAVEQTLAEELAATAERVRQSTVHVRTGRGAGSGVIWGSDGLIITNAHVARGSHATVEMWNGEALEAEVTAREDRRDLAALATAAAHLPAAAVADSDALRVGQLVVAVGNPLGLSGALTTGIIHAIAPTPGRGQAAWVQADIHLAPGNSGGPLADVQGRVLGINSMVYGGLGLAVPSNAVKRFLGEREGRLQLGLIMQPVLVPVGRAGTSLHGLLLLEVAPASPADAAGLTLGDIIIGVEGERFDNAPALLDALHALPSGDVVRLEILRGGTPTVREIPLPPAGDGARREGVGEAA